MAQQVELQASASAAHQARTHSATARSRDAQPWGRMLAPARAHSNDPAPWPQLPRAPQPASSAGCQSHQLARPVCRQSSQRTRPRFSHVEHAASGSEVSRPPVLPRPWQLGQGRWPAPWQERHLRGCCSEEGRRAVVWRRWFGPQARPTSMCCRALAALTSHCHAIAASCGAAAAPHTAAAANGRGTPPLDEAHSATPASSPAAPVGVNRTMQLRHIFMLICVHKLTVYECGAAGSPHLEERHVCRDRAVATRCPVCGLCMCGRAAPTSSRRATVACLQLLYPVQDLPCYVSSVCLIASVSVAVALQPSMGRRGRLSTRSIRDVSCSSCHKSGANQRKRRAQVPKHNVRDLRQDFMARNTWSKSSPRAVRAHSRRRLPVSVGGPRCATRPSGLLGREPLAVAA